MATGIPKAQKSAFTRLETQANETYSASGRQQAHYRKCLEALAGMSPAELARRQGFVERATEDLGLYADRFRSRQREIGAFSMDLFPRILRTGEWKRIESGVLQRMEAFGAFVRDIHGNKEILRSRRLPPQLVFEDPSFCPELQNVPMPDGCPISLGAVDLVRTVSGEWQVLENRFSTPTGISYVIQIRRILAQALPELFQSLPVYPVASFATRLSEALAEQAPGGTEGRPLVVLLSEGESGRHFFEESFLARHMGIPLTRPEDIVVREGRVFLKTIQGLSPIHVIYRRMEPPNVDPVAFASASENGIPGLIQCIRRGTVRVANALGCAVADNRALLRHSDAIIRHYTGQQPILPTVPTYHGYDLDQVDYIRENRAGLTLKTVCHPEILRKAVPEADRIFDSGGPDALLDKDPRLVVAQRIPEPGRLPVYRQSGPELEPVAMRVYCISGSRPYVLPGGLTRLFREGDERLASGRRHHFLKDTWALREQKGESGKTRRLEAELDPGEIPLPSTSAEAFYWMGRYLERGRGTARMMNTLEELRWGELTPGERELYLPLWRGILKATSAPSAPVDPLREKPVEAAARLLLEADDPASARSCFNAVRWNCQRIRSFITPEVWNSVLQAVELFEDQADNPMTTTATRQFMETVVEAGDNIYGTAHRTLLHDAGWLFFEIGLLIERGQTHVSILREVLPHIARRQWQHLRDDTDLTALLRLLGSLDAYHRKYRSRAYLDRVAQLLWKSPTCSGSVHFAVNSIENALHRLDRVSGHPITPPEIREKTGAFIAWLEAISLEKIFPARTVELDKGLTARNQTAGKTLESSRACLDHMQAFLESLHGMLEDRFFTHHPSESGSRAR